MHCQELYLGNFKSDLDSFAPSDSRFLICWISAKYCPILTNHTPMESLFIQLSDETSILISKNWHLRLDLWSKVTYCCQLPLYHSYLFPGEDLKTLINHILFTFHQLNFMLVIQISYNDSGMPVKLYYYFSMSLFWTFCVRAPSGFENEWNIQRGIAGKVVFSVQSVQCSVKFTSFWIWIRRIQNDVTIFSLLI